MNYVLTLTDYLLLKCIPQLINERYSIVFNFFKLSDALFQCTFFLLQLFG